MIILIMKKLLGIAVIFSLLSSFGHFYLAKRSYQLMGGLAGESLICNINETFNCDQALLSPYSHIFGISLSSFGLAFSLAVSLLLIMFFLLGLSNYWKNILFYLSGAMALASCFMAVVSVVYKLFCPVCLSLYFLSFLICASLFFVLRPNLLQPLAFVLQNLKEKSFYILGLVLLACSLFIHINFFTAFGIKDQREMLSALVLDWQHETELKITEQPMLRKGPEDSKIILVEFADFLCPACQRVQKALKNFLINFPDVALSFYVYPLDGSCNSSIDFVRSGLSCKLSQAVLCAEREGKGWPVHDFLFEKQQDFLRSEKDKDKIDSLLREMTSRLNINRQKFERCMEEEAVLDQIERSAQAGSKAQIEGTPSFFVNGKKLRGYSPKLLILRTIYEHLKKEGR